MTEHKTPVPPAERRRSLRAPNGERPKLPDDPSVDDYARAFLEVAWNYESHANRMRWVPYAVALNSLAIVLLIGYHLCVHGVGVCP